MSERDYDVALLKARSKLAKIPTSAIVEAEENERAAVYENYMDKWPEPAWPYQYEETKTS